MQKPLNVMLFGYKNRKSQQEYRGAVQRKGKRGALSVSYDFSLSAIVLVPKEEFISKRHTVNSFLRLCFENPAGDNTEKQFVTGQKKL